MKKLQVLLNENRERIIEVESFDFKAFDDEMKDRDSHGILIGERYFTKIDIREVGWLEENS